MSREEISNLAIKSLREQYKCNLCINRYYCEYMSGVQTPSFGLGCNADIYYEGFFNAVKILDKTYTILKFNNKEE